MEFSQEELTKATDAFGDTNLIGEGGFGRVFRAHDLRCTGTDAAVKVLSEVSWPDVFYIIIYCYYLHLYRMDLKLCVATQVKSTQS